MKKIIFQPQAVTDFGDHLEIIAGAELSTADVRLLVQSTDLGGPYYPVFLLCAGHKQRLTPAILESVLSEPLAEYRQQEAQKATEQAAAIEQAYQAAEALRIKQDAEKLALEAAQVVPLQTIG